MFHKYLISILICSASFPAMANQLMVDNYTIAGVIILAGFITVALLQPLKTKSLFTKIIIATLYFVGILSFSLGITYLLSM